MLRIRTSLALSLSILACACSEMPTLSARDTAPNGPAADRKAYPTEMSTLTTASTTTCTGGDGCTYGDTPPTEEECRAGVQMGGGFRNACSTTQSTVAYGDTPPSEEECRAGVFAGGGLRAMCPPSQP